MFENFLTPTQYAKKLGITRQRVCELVRQGRIRVERVGRQYFIHKSARIEPVQPNAKKLSQKNVTISRTKNDKHRNSFVSMRHRG